VISRGRLCCLALLALSCTGTRAHEKRTWLPSYAFGAIGGGDLDVRDVCPSGSAEDISVGSSLSTLAVSFATLGVYTPREAKVRCTPER
jgi:hypothetical protein